jgi:hypothetical protein
MTAFTYIHTYTHTHTHTQTHIHTHFINNFHLKWCVHTLIPIFKLILITLFIYLFIYLCLWVHMCSYLIPCLWRSEVNLGNWFFPSTKWILGSELRLPVLVKRFYPLSHYFGPDAYFQDLVTFFFFFHSSSVCTSQSGISLTFSEYSGKILGHWPIKCAESLKWIGQSDNFLLKY